MRNRHTLSRLPPPPCARAGERRPEQPWARNTETREGLGLRDPRPATTPGWLSRRAQRRVLRVGGRCKTLSVTGLASTKPGTERVKQEA